MNKKDVQLAKAKILKCLTEDFDYGLDKQGQPLKRRKQNQAIFDKQRGHAVFTGTDLEMVMDKVVLGLYFAMQESEETTASPASQTGPASTPQPVPTDRPSQ